MLTCMCNPRSALHRIVLVRFVPPVVQTVRIKVLRTMNDELVVKLFERDTGRQGEGFWLVCSLLEGVIVAH